MPEKNIEHIKGLDGLRGVSILMMMAYHSGILPFAWVSIQLFFVLSGFLIGGILWKAKFGGQTNAAKLKNFWARRSLRIFPLYFGWLIFLGVTYLLFQFPAYYTSNIVYLATYTFNFTRTFDGWQGNPLFTHLWSLSVEEQFYLFFPLLIFFLPARVLKFFIIIVIFLSPLLHFLLGRYYLNAGLAPFAAVDAVYWNTLTHLQAFFVGAAIPIFCLHKKIKKARLFMFVCVAVALFAGLFSFLDAGTGNYLLHLGYQHNLTTNLEYAWHYTLLNFAFASVVLFVVAGIGNKKTWLQKWLEAKWLTNIGGVSYGMYVFHWAILVYFFERLLPTTDYSLKLLRFIPYAAVVYLVAQLSFRYFESPFLRLKEVLFPVKKTGEMQQPGQLKSEAQLPVP